MPWIDPNTVHNPTTGVGIPAAWGDVVRDDLLWLATPPSCSVYGSAGQTLAHNTPAALVADSELSDAVGMHASNSSRITIPTGLGGRYMIVATVFFTSNGTGARIVRLRVDGSGLGTDTVAVGASAASSTVLSFSKPLVLTAGQYVEIMGLQTSGGDLVVQLTDFSAYFLPS